MPNYTTPMSPWPGLAPYERSLALPASGAAVHFYSAGALDDPAVLLIHGLGDEADTWRHLVEPLAAAGRRVLALDLPGFGRSEPLPGRLSWPRLVQVLLEFIEVAKAAAPVLIGHSLGAMLVHSLALQYPERLTKAVLISGGLAPSRQKLSLPLLLSLTPGLGEWLYTRLRRDPQRAYASLRAYYRDLAALPELERQFLFERVNQRVWSNTQRAAYLGVLRAAAAWLPRQQAGLPARLAANRVTTLLVWGEQDALLPPDNGRRLAALQPHTRLVTLPGAGHNLQQEQPAKLLAALQGFV